MSLILDGTNGLSDVDGSAATPAIRGTDANTGIFFGTDIIGFSEGGTEVARFNADSQFVAAAGTAALPVVTTTGDTNTGIFFPAADTIAFATGGTEDARFNSAGNLQTIGTISVGNATPSTSGAGITFPATQSASSDANTLDDYEEGSWTPAWAGSTSEPTASYATRTGQYVKIGKMVYCRLQINTSSFAGGSGLLQISGLPFTAGSGDVGWTGSVGWNSQGSYSGNQNMANVQIQPGSTRLYTHYITSTGATYDIVIGTGTNNSMVVEASIAYQVA